MNSKEIDWNEVWREQYQANNKVRGSGECALIWNSKEKAAKFLQMVEENPDRISRTLSNFTITKNTRVLDIGAGPGTLSVPLSESAGFVTAIEPAEGMVEVLKERIRQKSIQNLEIIHKRWEDVSLQEDLKPPYDLIIASHSLGMPDIRTAIDKMQNVCSGEIWLFWFAGTTSWEKQMIKLWPEIHGTPYITSPKSDVLFNVLYQMGIYPDIRFSDMEHAKKYNSIVEAIAEAREQLNCTDEFDSHIAGYLSQELKEQNGIFLQSGMTKGVSFTWSPGKNQIRG